MPNTFAPDYIQVNERIIAFKEKFPDGSLQSELLRLDDTIVVMKAYAFREPNDPRPGIGHSSLGIPGSTPYTKGSELENCETSAYGRALAALGFEVRRAVASAEEVKSKKGGGPSLDSIKARLLERASEHHIDTATLDELIRERIERVGTWGGGTADEVRAGLIALGTAIARGDFDAEVATVLAAETTPPGASGAPTDGLPPLPEQMAADEALAAGLALVPK